ncbi:MAG TPA: siroheme synthase CysG [Bradyrhizobium sp.]|uniref:siroheme synthase CysG n=1 Tax=Bradyrhizobium sp. TaxID=376 RepID=UPI002C7906D3|nr:siroheme synthase CysG [Bradyrhizobium sp.]HLZ04147.1 siroheme synthase CysG [Bradyrhizobium sp.]
MRYLPVFLDLQSGLVALLGTGELARAKLRVLVAAGARIRWYSPEGEHDIHGLEPAQLARIAFAKGDPLTEDLSGVVAIFCAGAGDVGVAMSARAKSVGLPVNVMDDVAHSTFIFPAIVDRGDVVVAIGTGGTSPVVARRVREKIEAVLPARIGDLAKFIGRFRKSIHARIPETPLRRRFWERVIDGPIGALVLSGHKDDAEAALNNISDPSAFAGADVSGKAKGHVMLVGAGPGDPDLLTIKALRALQDADVVFHDELVSSEILDRIRRDAARVSVGRRVGKPGVGQDAINELMIAAAKSGRRVVRLKGGDGFVFGRGGEEIDALRKAGISCSVVPGITAAIGAAAQFEVPLTFRRKALRITFLTAHKADDADLVDWSTLTDQQMTVVVYMGVNAAPSVRDGLRAAGRSPDTPVGVFARVTRPDAKAAVGTLEQLPDLIAQVDGGPAILIIGDVVAHSAPWRRQNLNLVLSGLLERAQ